MNFDLSYFDKYDKLFYMLKWHVMSIIISNLMIFRYINNIIYCSQLT